MTVTLYTGSMFSSKTRTLINKAERSAIRNRKYKIFYPSCCSNGKAGEVYSRANITMPAIAIQEVVDIFLHIDNTIEDIYIDEIQFLGSNFSEIEDLVNLIKYCEKKNINLYFAGLDLDYRGEAFVVTKEIMPYADKIKKLSAVCTECYSENARKSLRTKNGKPCAFNEETLIERNNVEYSYRPVCNTCYHKLYKGIK